MNTLVQIAAVLALILGLLGKMAGLSHLAKARNWHPEVARKIVHVAASGIAIPLPWPFPETWPVWLLLTLALAATLAMRTPLLAGPGRTLHSVARKPWGDVLLVVSAARRERERVALVTPQGAERFAGIGRRAFAARCAARGLGKGDRVLIAMPVGVDLCFALAACWRLGAVAVFPDPALGIAGLRHAVALTRPKCLFAAGRYRFLRLPPALWRCPVLSPSPADRGNPAPVPLADQDLALISFTSGSTGREGDPAPTCRPACTPSLPAAAR